MLNSGRQSKIHSASLNSLWNVSILCETKQMDIWILGHLERLDKGVKKNPDTDTPPVKESSATIFIGFDVFLNNFLSILILSQISWEAWWAERPGRVWGIRSEEALWRRRCCRQRWQSQRCSTSPWSSSETKRASRKLCKVWIFQKGLNYWYLRSKSKHLEAAFNSEEGGEEEVAIGEDVDKVQWSLVSMSLFTKTKTKYSGAWSRSIVNVRSKRLRKIPGETSS